MSARIPQPLLWACWLSAAFFNVGCDDSLKSLSLIEETRVLGARVEVAGDPSRSSPAAGERASLRLFVAAPNGAPNVAYALSVCAVSPTNSGFPSCVGAPFATALRADPAPTAPELEFQVPDDLDSTATPHAFVRALVCPDSAASDANAVLSCANGPGIEVAFEFDLATPDQSNQNPTFERDALTLDGAPWPAADPNTASCPGALPEVTANSRHQLGVDFQAADFEPLARATVLDPARETLLVSQFSSAGKLSHTFVSLNADTPAESRQVSWEAPALDDSAPSLARFYSVVRDSRGGEDFALRALCVVP